MSQRVAINLIEIDVPRCLLRYGETTGDGTCPAVLGVDSPIKCFNSFATCPVRDSYIEELVTLRFAVPSPDLDPTIERVAANVAGIDYTPAIISLGQDLGQRSQLRVSFVDAPHSDTGPGGDKYLSDRDYDPFRLGTFFGKLRARHPDLQRRKLRWLQGLAGQSLAEMTVRHFLIDQVEGLGADGRFSLTATDPLQFLEQKQAQAPKASKGALVGAIDADDTAATLTPAGIGNDEYPASGFIALGGSEIVGFTRSGDALTLTRAQQGTEASEHDAGERAQLCLVYTAEDPADVLYDLDVTYGGLDPAMIPLSNWQAETAAYFGQLVTACIAEPTDVDALESELIEIVGMAKWWDEEAAQLKLRVLRAIPTDAERFDDSNVLAGTLKVTEQPQKRLSQVWVFFGLRNPLEALDEPSNYRSLVVVDDLDAEELYGAPAIKKIFNRWAAFGGLAGPKRAANLQLGRFRTPPRAFYHELYRRGTETPEMGEGCRLEGQPMQDATGAREDVPIQIVSLKPRDDAWEVTSEEQLFVDLSGGDDLTGHPIIIDANVTDIDLRDLYDALYAAPEDGDVVNVTILEGVIVGSTSTSTPAVDVGSWPQRSCNGNRTATSPILTGVSVDTAGLTAGMFVRGTGIPAGAKILTVDSSSQITLDTNASSGSSTSTALTIDTVIINLKLLGRWQGRGGDGGQGATTGGHGVDPNGHNGLVGGDAFKTRYGTNLDLSAGAGEIWSGGGGGAGTGSRYFGFGDGGGGGAGFVGGSGGPKGGSTMIHGVPVEADGDPGTTESSGDGGIGYWAGYYHPGGNGGGPGLAGETPPDDAYGNPGTGAQPGKAIDGVSYLRKTGTGDIRGAQVN